MSEHIMAQMSEKEYREHPGVNKSTLWEIRKSPAHYKWALENPGEDTPALRMGRLIHSLVLQPETVDEVYAVAPSGIDRRTKDGKEAWARFCETSEGKEIVTAEDWAEAKQIAFSALSSAKDLLTGCVTEVPLFWDDPRTGIRCKCRVDAMKELDDRFVMIDLKTTTDASSQSFARDAAKYGYAVQAAHYINGVTACGLNHGKPIEWWFVAVEKKGPYAVNLLKASEQFIDEGQFRLTGLMDKLDECMRVDEYPGYGEGVINLPAWAIESSDEE